MSYTKDHIAEARFQFWVAETLQEGKLGRFWAYGLLILALLEPK
jgi:hypothetical protein